MYKSYIKLWHYIFFNAWTVFFEIKFSRWNSRHWSIFQIKVIKNLKKPNSWFELYAIKVRLNNDLKFKSVTYYINCDGIYL